MKKEYFDRFMSQTSLYLIIIAFLVYIEQYRLAEVAIALLCIGISLSMSTGVNQWVYNLSRPVMTLIKGHLYVFVGNIKIDPYCPIDEQIAREKENRQVDGFIIETLPYGINFWRSKVTGQSLYSVWQRKINPGDGRKRRRFGPKDRPTQPLIKKTSPKKSKVLHY